MGVDVLYKIEQTGSNPDKQKDDQNKEEQNERILPSKKCLLGSSGTFVAMHHHRWLANILINKFTLTRIGRNGNTSVYLSCTELLDLFIPFLYNSRVHLERSHSGLVRLLGKQVYRKVSEVRILSSPPLRKRLVTTRRFLIVEEGWMRTSVGSQQRG